MNFWDAQVYAVKSCEKVGIIFDLMDRVAVFKVWLELNRLWSNTTIPREYIDDARDAMNGILYFRNLGEEPPHALGVYVKKA